MAIHELAVTEEIFQIVLQHARDNRAKRVVSINLRVGDMLGLTEEWLQWYFDHLSRGTVAEGGKIVFKPSPPILQCENCSQTFSPDRDYNHIYLCPVCGTSNNKLISGREFLIESIGVIQ